MNAWVIVLTFLFFTGNYAKNTKIEKLEEKIDSVESKVDSLKNVGSIRWGTAPMPHNLLPDTIRPIPMPVYPLPDNIRPIPMPTYPMQDVTPDSIKIMLYGKCPKCGGVMDWYQIPCPDNRPGCLVLHGKPYCQKCDGLPWSRVIIH